MFDKENLKIIFKNNLNFLIQKKGVTQRDVADALKITPAAVNEWVKGKKVPRMDKIDKLCFYFSVPRSALLDDFETQKKYFDSNLNSTEKNVVSMFRNLTFVNQQLIIEVMKSFLNPQNIIAGVVQNNQNGHNVYNSNGNTITT